MGAPCGTGSREPSPAVSAVPASIPSAEFLCDDQESGYHDMCPCITAHVREIMQHWTGTNCTFADDDVTALGILAGKAIRAGLHYGDDLPASLIRCIDDKHTASEGKSATRKGNAK